MSIDNTALWHQRFMAMAELVAKWSKDPSTQVGAVAVHNRRVLSTGYNGFPPGVDDNYRLHDREEKYPRIVHAEENVVAFAANYGMSLRGATLYVWPFAPCYRCARLIISAGIKEVVYPATEPVERWADDFSIAYNMLREAGVHVVEVA